MNKIEKLFEACTGLSAKLPDNRYELTIFRKGYEKGIQVEAVTVDFKNLKTGIEYYLDNDVDYAYLYKLLDSVS